MKLSKQMMLAASALAITGGLSIAGGTVSAVTEHCPSDMTKVPAGGDQTSEDAGSLADGTEVCLKIGTKICFTTVQGGEVTNDDSCVQSNGVTTGIRNRNGVLQNISYWSHGDEPCEYPEFPNCEPPSS